MNLLETMLSRRRLVLPPRDAIRLWLILSKNPEKRPGKPLMQLNDHIARAIDTGKPPFYTGMDQR